MKTLTIECPDGLHAQLAELVKAGWFKSPEEGVVESETGQSGVITQV